MKETTWGSNSPTILTYEHDKFSIPCVIFFWKLKKKNPNCLPLLKWMEVRTGCFPHGLHLMTVGLVKLWGLLMSLFWSFHSLHGQPLEDGWRLHSRATDTAGQCSFEKINKSSNNSPGYHCIPFEWDTANRPLPRYRSHGIKLEACPLCSHSAQGSQRAQLGHHCHFPNDLVIRRNNGAQMNREGGGRVGFLRS